MKTRPIRLAATVLGLTVALGLAACDDTDAPADTDSSASRTPDTTPSSEAVPSDTPAGPDDSVAGAVSRFEEFLHAIGDEDVDTMCEIAGPAAKVAEDEGMGSCEQTFPMTLSMISAAQKAALSEATVDTSLVQENGDGTVFFPVECVVSDETFTESDLGSFTMEFQETDWFIID